MRTESKLKVKMLGEFSVKYGDKELFQGRFRMSKNVELFQMLMLYMKSGVPKSKIMQSIYDWDTINNRNRSLNNLIYRLKQLMVDEGVVQSECVMIQNGICKWCADIPVDVDTVAFEDAVTLAQVLEGEKRLQCLLQAFACYQGDFLPGMDGRPWVMEERIRLKRLFKICVDQIEQLLDSNENQERRLEVFSKAAEIYPFDEWQIGQIDSLQKMERYEEAYELYQYTVQKYFDELGMPPSDKMLDKIQHMSVNLRNKERSLEEISGQLEEKEQTGAYYCIYPSFVDIYRYIYRTVERSGQSVFFMVCSVIYLDSMGRKSPRAGEILLESIEMSLRKGDIFSRYSKHQFLILLTGTQTENCDMIFERIRRNFKKRNRNTNCDLEYNVAELIEFQEESQPLKFKKHKSTWK